MRSRILPSTVDLAERQAYQRGYYAGRQAQIRSVPSPAVYALPPQGSAYADMARTMQSMETFVRGLLNEYPHCMGQGRMDKWAAAAHAYIDFIACEEKPMKRVRLVRDGGES